MPIINSDAKKITLATKRRVRWLIGCLLPCMMIPQEVVCTFRENLRWCRWVKQVA